MRFKFNKEEIMKTVATQRSTGSLIESDSIGGRVAKRRLEGRSVTIIRSDNPLSVFVHPTFELPFDMQGLLAENVLGSTINAAVSLWVHDGDGDGDQRTEIEVLDSGVVGTDANPVRVFPGEVMTYTARAPDAAEDNEFSRVVYESDFSFDEINENSGLDANGVRRAELCTTITQEVQLAVRTLAESADGGLDIFPMENHVKWVPESEWSINGQ